MSGAYEALFNGSLVVLAILLFLCLIRAIRGPRISDRIVAVNMMGTLIVIIIYRQKRREEKEDEKHA